MRVFTDESSDFTWLDCYQKPLEHQTARILGDIHNLRLALGLTQEQFIATVLALHVRQSTVVKMDENLCFLGENF
ncbi:hypothetical protein [Nostoc sp.]|uniref:hypothetical protein n=1 Tax=Nostoc sp. TaxID=1180 RepID=UPI002FF9C276